MSIVAIALDALAYGSALAIGCASITLLYASTRTFNFAHASMITWSFYLIYTFYRILSRIYGITIVPYVYIPLVAIAIGLIGLAIYYSVIRYLLGVKASEITLMMVTLGIDIMLYGFVNIWMNFLMKYYRFSDASKFYLSIADISIARIGITYVRAIHIVAPLTGLVIIMLIHLFLTRTTIGISMRASIESPELASILGINVYKIYALAWLIGGILAGVSGSLLTMLIEGTTDIGSALVVYFFAGSIVGGLYSVYGGLLGGLLIGFSERLIMFLIPPLQPYRSVIPLAALIITLLIYPSGLAGVVRRR